MSKYKYIQMNILYVTKLFQNLPMDKKQITILLPLKIGTITCNFSLSHFFSFFLSFLNWIFQ